MEDNDEYDEDWNHYLSDEENSSVDEMVPPAGSHKNLWNYEILDSDKVFELMNNEIQLVIDTLSLSPQISRLLLNYFEWDKENLIESYLKNEKNILEKAEIPHQLCSSIVVNKATDSNAIRDCEICYCQFVKNDMIGLECNHCYCRDCYEHYVKSKITDEGIADSISCIEPKCKYIVNDKIVMNLITDHDVRVKYMRLITNSFVQCNRLLRWCPSPHCNNAIQVFYFERRSVKCNCGYAFCFNCSEINHDPIKCDLLLKWKLEAKTGVAEAESLKWLDSHTKKCPSCKANIEKNGGCNHMTCRSCSYHFCWICLVNYAGGSHNCNAFQGQRNNANTSASYERYLHYFQRYANHKKSLDLDKNLYTKMLQIENNFIENGMSSIELKYLKNAVNILCDCRQTLMNTYIFAFYLKQTNSSIIFEDNQKDLEIATENLSRYLEHNVKPNDKFPDNMKQEIQDKYKYCELRQNVLLNYVYDGYLQELWNS